MDKREMMEQRDRERRRAIRRKRRQRQMIKRLLLCVAAVAVIGFGIKVIVAGMMERPEKDSTTEVQDKEQNISDGWQKPDREEPEEQEPEEPVKQEPEEPKDPCIVLDAGHGGTDPGTMWKDIMEKDINLAITKKLKNILEEAGYQVVVTREGDDRTVLNERIRIAQENNTLAFVSIHQNALEKDTVTDGIQVFYNQNTNRSSEELARSVHSCLLQATGARDRELLGDSNLYILKNTNVPACLVETGFLTNTKERKKLLDEDYQQTIAEGIAEGILNFLET